MRSTTVTLRPAVPGRRLVLAGRVSEFRSDAIKVIQNGRVYYVCSEACLVKLKQKKKK